MSGLTVPLVKPVAAHGDEVSELTFREPLPEDVMQIGMPTLLIPSSDGESVGVEIRAKVIGQYISRLAGIPMSSVKALAIADFLQCQGVIMGFFGSGGGEA
ncbi:MAG: phage tail assembly protein [Aquabacterium sp.]|nr:phage tail assembly protein [Aquabacterium sp.]